MSGQLEKRSSCEASSKRRRNNSRIIRLEERMERIEERLGEFESLAVQVDGEIISVADWRERHSREL